ALRGRRAGHGGAAAAEQAGVEQRRHEQDERGGGQQRQARGRSEHRRPPGASGADQGVRSLSPMAAVLSTGGRRIRGQVEAAPNGNDVVHVSRDRRRGGTNSPSSGAAGRPIHTPVNLSFPPCCPDVRPAGNPRLLGRREGNESPTGGFSVWASAPVPAT